jgi:hypothetical protein
VGTGQESGALKASKEVAKCTEKLRKLELAELAGQKRQEVQECKKYSLSL